MNNLTQADLFNTIILSSGKSPNDLGNFEKCVSRGELEYALVTVAGESSFRERIQIGMCVPKECTSETL